MKDLTLHTAYCRGFQAVMKMGNYALDFRTPETVEGPGSVKELPRLLRERGLSRVLVVTDRNLMELGLPKPMLEALDAEGVDYTLFSDLALNPTSDNVEAGLRLYKERNCQGLVAFGGGAPMDCAKAIGARVVCPHRSVAQLQGVIRVLRRIPPLFAIPTTAGTGSETTVAALITISETHHKASINDPAIMPACAILDPELTVGLPPFVTATTGLDALCHAVEAYLNHTYNTPLEDRMALTAVRLVHANLLRSYRDGHDLTARQNMQKASFCAGRAFTRACVGYVHAVGHTLGGLYGVPHGLAMSVILPHVLRQYGSAVYHKLADLADICGIEGRDDKEKALAFIAWIEELQREMDIPKGFDCIRDEDIPQIIDWAKAEANPLYPVPVVWGSRELRRLIVSIRL